MPLTHYFITPTKKGRVGVWDIAEQEPYFRGKMNLREEEEIILQDLGGKRRLEWLAGRMLLQRLSRGNDHIVKDQWGKPHLVGSPYEISISHSKDRAAAIIGEGLVGVDIQALTRQMERVAHRVIQEEKIKDGDPYTRLLRLHVYWGAKEALYKAYGMRDLDFTHDMRVEPFEFLPEGGSTLGFVCKKDFQRTFDIYYRQLENYMLVYAMEK